MNTTDCGKASAYLINSVPVNGYARARCRLACKSVRACAVFLLGVDRCELYKAGAYQYCTITDGEEEMYELHATDACGCEFFLNPYNFLLFSYER